MGSRILLADDEAAIASELAPLLAHSGFEVAVARDGEEALSKAASFKPDLIVLDVLMPQLAGREACRRLASGPLTPDRPSRRALLEGREIVLTAKAFALLEYLMLHAAAVSVSRVPGLLHASFPGKKQ